MTPRPPEHEFQPPLSSVESLQKEPALDAALGTEAKEPGANDDAALFSPDIGLYGVLDGVRQIHDTSLGTEGHSGQAAELAAITIEKFYRNIGDIRLDSERQYMHDALIAAHVKVKDRIQQSDGRFRGSTTVLAVRLWQHPIDGQIEGVEGHIGDSRAVKWTPGELNGTIEHLTLDDDMSAMNPEDFPEERRWEMQRAIATSADPSQHPDEDVRDRFAFNSGMSQILGQEDEVDATGTHFSVKPNIREFALQPGECLILSTDGLHDNLSDPEIAKILATCHTAEEAQASLIAKAKAASLNKTNPRHKPDDITVEVIMAKKTAQPSRVD
jgi:serine/threonine protein phosphatase PrpC